MNKVFKVIWSEARNAYVVVSEIAKNHGSKSCSTKKLLTMLIATGVMTCASMAPAMAAPNVDSNANVTVTNGANITVTEGPNKDGGKEYKVALKNDITLEGDDPDAFVGISGSKGTIWTSGKVTAGSVAVGTAKADGTTPFFVDSNGAFYAADGKFSVDKDGNANANSIQTNVLNSKYNLSVGTANENGTMPFFVNSNGAFYAANGKLVVDKDGKVTATEGEIGNVVLKNGVLYKNTALRDGELFVGDASGNYSQITTKGAKLGKVTVAADGKISGVAAGAVTADSTDAVNGSQLHAVATEASKHTTLSNGKNTTVTSTNKDGQVDYQVNVAGDLKDITSVSNGDSKINLNADSISISNGNKSFAITNSGIGMSYITADYSTKSIMLGENGTTISGGLNVAGSKITGVAAGVADTDAVNVGQLKEAVEAGNTDTHIKPGEYGVGADNTVKMDVVDKNGNKVDTVTIKDVAKASDVGNVNNIASDIKNQDGSHTTVVDAVNNLNNKVGDLQYSKVEKGDIADGDSTTTAIGKLDQKLTDVAATAAKHTTVT